LELVVERQLEKKAKKDQGLGLGLRLAADGTKAAQQEPSRLPQGKRKQKQPSSKKRKQREQPRESAKRDREKRAAAKGETQTQVGVDVRGDFLREFLLDSRCTKRCALQRRSQNCLQARAWISSSPLNLVFVTASCFGSENGIFYHFKNQWHRF
jgi:hypothetical protein